MLCLEEVRDRRNDRRNDRRGRRGRSRRRLEEPVNQVMYATEGMDGMKMPVCSDIGNTALGMDSSGSRRLLTVLETEEPEAHRRAEELAAVTSADEHARRLARRGRGSSRRRQTAVIKRSRGNVDKKIRSMPVISRRRTPAPTPPPPAVSVSLKKDYNFVTKFAFDIYGEICEGKRSGDQAEFCHERTTWAKGN